MSRRKFEVAELGHPVVVVDQHGRSSPASKSSNWRICFSIAVNVGSQRLHRQQIALFALAAGIADHPGGSADQGDGPMPGPLESSQCHQRQEVADVQAVGRRIETGVNVRDCCCSATWSVRLRRLSGGSIPARLSLRKYPSFPLSKTVVEVRVRTTRLSFDGLAAERQGSAAHASTLEALAVFRYAFELGQV